MSVLPLTKPREWLTHVVDEVYRTAYSDFVSPFWVTRACLTATEEERQRKRRKEGKKQRKVFVALLSL
jgi:hypothetical protein